MDATPNELRNSDIDDAFRGYNREEVDDLLDRAAATIERLQESNRQLTERASEAESEAGRGRETEDMLHRTLLLAQRTADEAVAEARARSTQIVEEAEARSRNLLSEAESSARRVADAEQKRLATEVQDLTSRRDALRGDVAALETFGREYRSRLRALIEADLDLIADDRTPPLPPKPTLRTVDEQSAPPVSWSAPPPTESSLPPTGADSLRATTLPAANAGETTAASESSMTESEVPEATAAGETVVDLDAEETMSYAALSEPRPDEAPSEGRSGGRLFHAESAAPLDDDAFFASLRDAVRDDSPLGDTEDRDPGPEGLYDQDSNRDELRYGTSAESDTAGYGLFRRRR